MSEKRVQFSNIVQNQLPDYVRDEYPLISEFLKQYYIGQEYQSGPIDLIQNIDQYTKIDEFTNLSESVGLKTDITSYDDVIPVDMLKFPEGTVGFPTSYGLIKIDDEVITYTGRNNLEFTGCIRGFSGITSYRSESNPESIVFKSTSISHTPPAHANSPDKSVLSSNSITFVKSILSSWETSSSLFFLGSGSFEKSGGKIRGFFFSIKNSSIFCFFFILKVSLTF